MRVKLARSMRAGAATAIRRLRVNSHVCAGEYGSKSSEWELLAHRDISRLRAK